MLNCFGFVKKSIAAILLVLSGTVQCLSDLTSLLERDIFCSFIFLSHLFVFSFVQIICGLNATEFLNATE